MKSLYTRHSIFKMTALSIVVLFAFTLTAQTGTLPVMQIETRNRQPITSKTVYIPGTYYLVDNQNPDFNLGSAKQPLSLEIRGRGHSSWKGVKKPYKIRLTEKAPLLGMNKHKHWALLKYYEPTVAGMRLGEIMGMDWTPSTRPVEVVLNGDYLGLYLLTETNRISRQRLNIYEQPNWNEDESTIPYGWLVEVDNYYEPNSISIKENNSWNMRFTYHSPDSLSAAQRNWLINEFQHINTVIYDEDKVNSSWEQLIDVDAMARYFIIQEVLDNSDGFHGSFYLHKDLSDDARWVAGPLWDLSCNQRAKTDYTFRMKTSYGFTPHWIGELIKDGDFCRAVRNAWNDFYPTEIQSWMSYIDERLLPCHDALEAEKIRWSYTNQETLEVRVGKLKSALLANIEWFNNNLPDADTSTEVVTIDKKIVKVEYINLAGIRSAQPWSGVNIKVTTYDDGSTSTTKILFK
ncbi:MAG: CotH kinase family protein [Muribaculaceae bacterium]|nr:CotH kinase family protein [Muribaculaceae bacterium]